MGIYFVVNVVLDTVIYLWWHWVFLKFVHKRTKHKNLASSKYYNNIAFLLIMLKGINSTWQCSIQPPDKERICNSGPCVHWSHGCTDLDQVWWWQTDSVNIVCHGFGGQDIKDGIHKKERKKRDKLTHTDWGGRMFIKGLPTSGRFFPPCCV